MSFLDLFKRKDINKGIEECKTISGAMLPDAPEYLFGVRWSAESETGC